MLVCEVVSKVADTYVVKSAAHASRGKLKKNWVKTIIATDLDSVTSRGEENGRAT